MPRGVEIDLILKGIKTRDVRKAQSLPPKPSVEIDLILKGIKTKTSVRGFSTGGQVVEIDLILKGIKTCSSFMDGCLILENRRNRPDSQRD